MVERSRQEKAQPEWHESRKFGRSPKTRAAAQRNRRECRGLMKMWNLTMSSAFLSLNRRQNSFGCAKQGTPTLPETWYFDRFSRHPSLRQAIPSLIPQATDSPHRCREIVPTRRSMQGKMWKTFGTRCEFRLSKDYRETEAR